MPAGFRFAGSGAGAGHCGVGKLRLITQTVFTQSLEAGIRCEIDERNEKSGIKSGSAAQKIPYMLIVGDKELASGSVAVRSRDAGDLGTVPLDKFIAGITEEIRTRKSH